MMGGYFPGQSAQFSVQRKEEGDSKASANMAAVWRSTFFFSLPGTTYSFISIMVLIIAK